MEIKNEAIDELLKDYQKPEDVIGENRLLKRFIKAVLERAMSAELTHHLGYEKHEQAAHYSGSSCNGISPKTAKGDFGQFADFVRLEVSKVLEAVHSLSLKISAPRDKDTASIGPSAYIEQQEDDALRKRMLASNANTPPTPSIAKKSTKGWCRTFYGWKTRLEFPKLVLEIVATPFAIAYAVVTYYQWQDLRYNVRIDQGARVDPTGFVMQQFEVGKDIIAFVSLTNTGKATARIELKTAIRPFPSELARNRVVASNVWKNAPTAKFIIFAGQPRAFSLLFTTDDERNILQALVPDLLPRYPMLKPMQFTMLGLKATPRLLLSGFVEVHYVDVFGNWHSTRMCGQYDPDHNGFITCHGYQEYAD